jgi:hypothetical protein
MRKRRTLEQWKAEVNRLFLQETLGLLETEDMYDMPYIRWYEAGVTPRQAVQKIKQEARTY